MERCIDAATLHAPVEDRPGEIRTYTGRIVRPLELGAGDVELADIAHALSQDCRFSGHTRFFYSVAQHSLLVCDLVDRPDWAWALLHDASEAYLRDLARPLKHHESFAFYREAETRVQAAVCERFGLPMVMPAAVAAADRDACLLEMRLLMGVDVALPRSTAACRIELLSPRQVERSFLARARRLGIQ